MDRFGRREIREFFVTASCLGVVLVFLWVERLLLARSTGRVPLRICVTGSRGKSRVVRLIAACLKDSRMPVLAKTTGSKPCLFMPDGEEIEIRRRGHPTILEAKKILKVAAGAGAGALVLEMMSIRPETLFVESARMIRPHILVITNNRLDHVEEMGKTKEEIARSFASAIPKRGAVILPREEFYPVFEKKAAKAGAELILAPPDPPAEAHLREEGIPAWEFEQNYRVALAVAGYLGLDRDRAWEAMRQSSPDFGGLRIWSVGRGFPAGEWYFVSAFGANDPESAGDVLVKLEARGLFEGRKKIGLFNWRKDRGGRTMQWFDALQNEEAYDFDRLIFVGDHAPALRNRLKKRIKAEVAVFEEDKPEELIARITALEKGEAVVLGMGNMGGMGRKLVEYWERTGIGYDG